MGFFLSWFFQVTIQPLAPCFLGFIINCFNNELPGVCCCPLFFAAFINEDIYGEDN